MFEAPLTNSFLSGRLCLFGYSSHGIKKKPTTLFYFWKTVTCEAFEHLSFTYFVPIFHFEHLNINKKNEAHLRIILRTASDERPDAAIVPARGPRTTPPLPSLRLLARCSTTRAAPPRRRQASRAAAPPPPPPPGPPTTLDTGCRLPLVARQQRRRAADSSRNGAALLQLAG